MKMKNILIAAACVLPVSFPAAASAQTASCQITGEYDTENHPTAPLYVEASHGEIRGSVGDMLYKGVAKPFTSCVFGLRMLSLPDPDAFDGHTLEFVSSAGKIKASMTRPGGSVMTWGATRTLSCTPRFGHDFDKLFDMKANAAAYETQCRLQSSPDCALFGELMAGTLRPTTPGLDLIGACEADSSLTPIGIKPVMRPMRPDPVLEKPVEKPSGIQVIKTYPKAQPSTPMLPDGR